MPTDGEVDRRNRALIAFILMTGMRDTAVASLRMKHIDIARALVTQDPREVRTKFRKLIQEQDSLMRQTDLTRFRVRSAAHHCHMRDRVMRIAKGPCFKQRCFLRQQPRNTMDLCGLNGLIKSDA